MSDTIYYSKEKIFCLGVENAILRYSVTVPYLEKNKVFLENLSPLCVCVFVCSQILITVAYKQNYFLGIKSILRNETMTLEYKTTKHKRK